MASEYLKKKYKDVKPEEKRELTPAEKRKNWWHYHKWHLVIGAVLLAIPVGILWDTLHQVKPDYQIAYVGENTLPDGTEPAIEAVFAALGEDLNGDGRIIVRLSQYISSSESNAQAVMSATMRLMADMAACESYFFLLEDPEQFQQNYGSLRHLDGSMSEEILSAGETCLLWNQCPALAGMELGETVSGLYIGRRGFWTDKTCPYPEGCDALWEKIVEGAVAS